MKIKQLELVEALAEALAETGINAWVDDFACVRVNSDVFSIWISIRPHYCDRGRFLLHVDSKRPEIAEVDFADMFPRYYFHVDCLVKEFCSWIEVRQKDIDQKIV